MKAGDWKLRGIRRGFEKGTRPVYMGNEDVKHICIVYLPKNQRMQFMDKKCCVLTRNTI
jgi:hypothetical protein